MSDRAREPAFVVLAAGEARRLGEPKAAARIGGRPALLHVLDAWRAAPPADATAPVVVLGAHADELTEVVPPDAQVVLHPAWAAGRTGSVARAVSARPGRDLLIASVDQPLVAGETLHALVRAWRREGHPPRGWLAPAAVGPDGRRRPGHPILIGRELLAQLSCWPSDRPLRELRSAAEPLWTVEVDDPAVHDDLDWPADLERLRRRFEGPA